VLCVDMNLRPSDIYSLNANVAVGAWNICSRWIRIMSSFPNSVKDHLVQFFSSQPGQNNNKV